MDENITTNEDVNIDVETPENDNFGIVLAVVAGIAATITGAVLLRKKFRKTDATDDDVIQGEVVED